MLNNTNMPDEYIGLSIREYGEYSELELKTILEFINEV